MVRFRVEIVTLVVALVSCHGMFEERTSVAPCDRVTCSGHGTCRDDDERAECRCDDGYEADGLECVPVGADADVDTDVDSDNDTDIDSDREDDGDTAVVPDASCGPEECAVVYSHCECRFECERVDRTCGDLNGDEYPDPCDDSDRGCPWEPGMSPPPDDLLTRSTCTCHGDTCFDEGMYCQTDEDCVPEDCCRPTRCVARRHRACDTFVCCECEDCRPCIRGCMCVDGTCRTDFGDGCC